MPSLADILSGALAQVGLETTSDAWRIADAWEALVGARIARRATPIELRRDELVLAVPDAVWRQELSYIGPEIVARVNEMLGAPRVTRLRLSSAAPRPLEERPTYRRLLGARAPAPSEPAPVVAEEASDGEIDDALRRLARARAARLERDSSTIEDGPRPGPRRR
jgi:hypothetical protein